MRLSLNRTSITTTLLVPVFVLVALVGCGDDANQLTFGKVIDKEYDDPDSETYCASRDPKTFLCWYWDIKHDPAHWRIKIQGVDGREDVEEWHEVSEDVYDALHQGDLWRE